MKALIALEDGTIYEGESFGSRGEKEAEVIFNTSMTGYQEILTDPSYKGQFVVMTYPLIGNYGINPEDVESIKPQVEGFIIRESSQIVSNWRAKESLNNYLKKYKIMGVEGIDTRALTRHIRLEGAMKAVISTEDYNKKSLVEKAKASPGLIGRDLVKEVSSKKVKRWSEKGKYKVIVVDCGVKFNILRELAKRDCQVIVVPAKITADEILRMRPDGILLSNGPGDPAPILYLIKTVKKLVGKIPIFGICLGHQIVALALGGKTYKLKFGHHGANHPVKDLQTDKISITVQNHGFCVDVRKRPPKDPDRSGPTGQAETRDQRPEDKYYMVGNEDVEITHVNLNDGTCEGLRHKKLPIFSVQFHPEASPGPHDAKYLFREFIELIKKSKRKT